MATFRVDLSSKSNTRMIVTCERSTLKETARTSILCIIGKSAFTLMRLIRVHLR